MLTKESVQGISFVNDDTENDRYYTLLPLLEKPVASLNWNTLQFNLQSGGTDIFKEQYFLKFLLDLPFFTLDWKLEIQSVFSTKIVFSYFSIFSFPLLG